LKKILGSFATLKLKLIWPISLKEDFKKSEWSTIEHSFKVAVDFAICPFRNNCP
jgi:hypothetical protein